MSLCEYCGKEIKEGNRFCHGHNNSKNNPGFKIGFIPWNKDNDGNYMRGEKNPFFGKKHTEESNQKNREKHLGKPSERKGKESQEKINKFQEQYPWDLEILYKEDLIKLGVKL